MRKKIVAGLAVLALGAGLTACGTDKSREDAADTQNIDKTAPLSIAFNNHFPNVETKCDGFGHRIWVGSHDSSTGNNMIVLPDPSCPGFKTGEPTVVASP